MLKGNGLVVYCELIILLWIQLTLPLYLPTLITYQCVTALISGNGNSILLGCMDLDYAIRIERPPALTNDSTVEQRANLEK